MLEDLSKWINVMTRKGQKYQRKYKLQNENNKKMAKERIKLKELEDLKKQRNRTGRIKYLRLMHRNATGRWENNPSKSKSLSSINEVEKFWKNLEQ